MSFLFGGRPKSQMPSSLQAAAGVSIQQSAYSTPIPLVYGTNRISCNLLWYGAFNPVQITTNTGGGGGGGGKGGLFGGGSSGSSSTTTWNYYASFATAICEGTISNVGQVFVSKSIANLSTLAGSLFTGTSGQAAWGYLSSNFPDAAQQYTDLAYVGYANYNLGSSSQLPQFSYEVFGLSVFGSGVNDASPEQFIIDFLTRAGFPSGYIDTFTNLKNYCRAMGFFISPVIDQQRTAIDWLKEIMLTLNCEFVWSNGVLTAVPYADSSVVGTFGNYTPNLIPIYNIGEDDLIRDGDVDPIIANRTEAQDAYNQCPIEYINSADQYNSETYTAFDDAAATAYGFRIAPSLRAHHVTNAPEAQTMAQIWLRRQLYTRTTYTFKLPWNYILLDPMDCIALNDTNLGLSNALVRIISIEEDEKEGLLTFTAEEVPGNLAAPALQPTFGATRSFPNYNVDPGLVNTPVFFETPLALVQKSVVEVDIALSGNNNLWGGCQIYVSTDNETYQYVDTFNGSTRMGVTTNSIPTYVPAAGNNNIDSASILDVSMVESRGAFSNAATNADAVNLNTLCYVGGEFLAFGNDSLTAPNTYALSYLNRGAYGSTIASHASGVPFVRYDDQVFAFEANQSYVGTTLYFKFLSFNVWGGGMQTLAEVPNYTYTPQGTALLTPLANPTNLAVSYTDNIAQLNWSPIADLRTPILYQIRKGSSFASAQVIGYSTSAKFVVWGTDTYWVTGYYFTPFGVPVYSSSPPSVAVMTAALQDFLIESFSEDPSWTGTCSGGAAVSGSTIILSAGDILVDPDIIATPDIIYYGGIDASGTYTAPSGHTISSNYIINAKVMCNWTISGSNISGSDDIILAPDVLSLQDILDGVAQANVYAQPQIRLSQNGGSSYGAWQNWTPGVYQFNAIQFRINIYSLSSQVEATLSAFSFEVDVPQLTQTGSLSTSAAGNTTVTFTDEFNVTPIVTGQIVSAVAGDLLVISSVGASSFAVEVLNSGSAVVRTVSWAATGY